MLYILPSSNAPIPEPVRCMLSFAKYGTPLWTVTTDTVMYGALADIVAGAYHTQDVHELVCQTASQMMGPAMGCDSVDNSNKREANAAFYEQTMTAEQKWAVEQVEGLIEYCTNDVQCTAPIRQTVLSLLMEYAANCSEDDSQACMAGYGCETAYGNSYANAIINMLTTLQSDELVDRIFTNIQSTDEQSKFFSR